ncbi:MAG: hypothetical protein IKE60_26300 [Reyranella sp.]|uniref:hypothetical protein n=1 Tax=Reyranella sp. TaxID=1929291 RepID=UPI0025DFC2C9|nr:hypothetical protein [Reyranella sp.]MBR2818201.1 hypothetical protein [Reyranella sp.]
MITLTDDQIKSIFTSAESDRAEAERYKVKLGLIQNIRDRKMFAYTTMDLRRPRSATEPEPDQPDQKLGPSRGRFPPTPGIDFEQLKASHRNLRRPRLAINTKKIRIKPGYDDAPTIYAYLIPVHTRN